jgi:hypothetical protein
MLALKEADRLVKEGRLEEALEIILAARREEPGNLYALAYEERVRTLVRRRAEAPPPEASGAPPVSGPEDSSPPQGEARLEDRLTECLTRVHDLRRSGDHALALQEISRARMLAPDDSDLFALQQEIEAEFGELRKRLAAERKKAELEERERRKKAREEEERTRGEETERAQHAEERARSEEQERKVGEYLRRAEECFSAGNLEAAVAELSFVMVLDPDNAELRRLQEAISLRSDELRRAREQTRMRREEQSKKKQQALREAVRQHLTAARRHADHQEFAEALQEITRAYLLDPTSDEAHRMEASVLEEQRRAMSDSVRRMELDEEQRWRREEEERARREELEREREQAIGRAREEARRKTRAQALDQRVMRARTLLTEKSFEASLGEIALGYLIDPFDARLKELEQEVKEARAAAAPASEAVTEEEPDHTAEVDGLRAEAEGHLARREFPAALDCLARALALDPLNSEIPDRQESIRAEEIRWREEEAVRERKRARDEAVARHRESAETLLAEGSLDEAFTEALLGSRLTGDEEAFADLRARIDRAIMEREEQRAAQALLSSLDSFMDRTRNTMADTLRSLSDPPEAAPPEPPPARQPAAETPAETAPAALHVDQAREYFMAGRFDDALAEVALGLALDPENRLLALLEKEIWKQQNENTELDPEREQLVRLHLLSADEFAKRGDLMRALDEIAAAYAIDPSNKETRKAEMRIRQMELHGRNDEDGTLTLVYPSI